MNLTFIETFLDISETRNFNKSAERLNVTQSTVSARMRALEDELRTPLFRRGRFGAELTAAGHKLLPHAILLKNTWNQARQELALPEGFTDTVRIATQPSLYDAFIKDWLVAMRRHHPKIAIYVEADYSPAVLDQISNGTVDIGIIYIPRALPGLVINRLYDEKFILISTEQTNLAEIEFSDYTFIDWSPHFKKIHLDLLPHLQATPISVGLGSMAIDYIREQGGSAFFPERIANKLITEAQMYMIKDAPIITQPVYTVVAENIHGTSAVQKALDQLSIITH